jgi:archaellum component FlaC
MIQVSGLMTIREHEAQIETLASEIKQLKSSVEMMTEQAVKFRDMAVSHAVLLTRAADALEGKYQNENVGLNHEDVVEEFKSFIAELRKAAQ